MEPFVTRRAGDHAQILWFLAVAFEADRTVLALFPQSETKKSDNKIPT